MSQQQSSALDAQGPPGPAIQFYTVVLTPDADGRTYVAVAATLCDHEGEFENMDLGHERVGTIDDALQVIRAAVVATLPTRLTQENPMSSNQQPAYRAFTVIKREGQDDYWLPIGAAFAHQSGDGFNVVLQALPIPDRDGQCKIVLRPPKADDARGDKDSVHELNARHQRR